MSEPKAIKFVNLSPVQNDLLVYQDVDGIIKVKDSPVVAIRGKFKFYTVETTYVIADGRILGIPTAVGPILICPDGSSTAQAMYFHSHGVNVVGLHDDQQQMVSHLQVTCFILKSGEQLWLNHNTSELRAAA